MAQTFFTQRGQTQPLKACPLPTFELDITVSYVGHAF